MNFVILNGNRSHPDHTDLKIEVRGQNLLARTAKQFEKYGEVTTLGREKPEVGLQSLGMISKPLEYIEETPYTVIFGDVYFTHEAVATIAGVRYPSWRVFGRSTDNPYTGKPYAEWFAFHIANPAEVGRAKDAWKRVADDFVNNRWYRATAWEWYYAMEGMSLNNRNASNMPTGKHWVEINDITDDIDYQVDADRMTAILKSKEGWERTS